LKLLVLWLHILFSPVMRVDRALCRLKLYYSYSVDFGYVLLFEVTSIVAAYFIQSCYACGSCTVQPQYR